MVYVGVKKSRRPALPCQTLRIERFTMRSHLWRLFPCALGCLFLWSPPAPAQFVYRLGGPVLTQRGLAMYHLRSRRNFKRVEVNPYGAYPYGVMYSGFNHGHYPPLDGVIDESASVPVPEVLSPPRQKK
jgi:hypothetical protein